MRFPSTRRSAVVAAGSLDAGERRRGWEALVGAYWKPVYKFVRIKWEYSAEDAADLTQGFFARAMEKDFFRAYDAARGSFRTFLRTCLEGFVANERKAGARLKRGGDVQMLSLDFVSAEGELFEHPPAAGSSPEELFQREWVRSLFAMALEDLKAECEAREKQIYFRLFERYDVDAGSSYAELADEFQLPVTSVTNYLAWARREFRRLLLGRLREITGGDEEYRADAKALLGMPL
ncbi:MAG TPA: ECF-type sigma factor [Bryobacteraceae bacterium]|nr:ECF-type sigma factor [Bryobacteraceae bacterium]